MKPDGRLQPDELLRAALAGTGTSVWQWHIETDVLDDTDEGTAMLGYAPGEVAPTQAAWTALMHPDDRDANDAAYDRHVRGEVEVYEHEYRIRARDDSWRWISERGRIVERTPDGQPLRMLGTQTDITERRQAEVAARELAERLRKIARHVPGMVFQFLRTPDGGGRFPYVSDSCQALIGLPSAVLMDDAVAMLRMVERDDRALMRASIQRSMRTLRAWHCEFRLHRRDKGVRWMSGTATPQREPDGSVLWHGYMHDTTDLRELEQARQARAMAEAANRAKTEFLSRISHELRTPLNAVLGFSQLLEIDAVEPLSGRQLRRVALIREAGEHLLHMIGDLLDLTRIESGRLGVALADVALAPLLRECVDMLHPQAEAASVRVEMLPLDESLGARADRIRLKQVIANLLTNAIKYNRPAGNVRLWLAPRGDTVVLHVADSGLGIAPQDLARLFEPFNRLSQERGSIEGTGIGLALSRGLVETMGGRITVQSELGVGSTFSVSLPSP